MTENPRISKRNDEEKILPWLIKNSKEDD